MIVVAALLVVSAVGLVVWVYREYGPLLIREAPTKAHFPFPYGAETVTFSPDGRRLAAGGKSVVTVWERASGRVVWEWTQGPSTIRTVAYSPDGGQLAVLGRDGYLTLRNANTGACRLTCHPGEPDPPAAFVEPDTDTRTRSASSTCFTLDGKWLATGHFYGPFRAGVPGEVRVWDATTGQLVRKIATSAGVMALAVSPGGKLLAVGDAAGGMQLWDLATDQRVHDLPRRGCGAGIAFTPGGREVVYAGRWCGEENPATVWDLKAGTARPLAGGRQSYAVYVHSLAVSPDGRRLALGELVKDYRRPGQRVWDLGSGSLLADYDCPTQVAALTYSPDGRELAVGFGREVQVWDTP